MSWKLSNSYLTGIDKMFASNMCILENDPDSIVVKFTQTAWIQTWMKHNLLKAN